MTPQVDTPVVVVGLGPVGAVLTGLLGRRKHRVVAVDRAADVFPLPRAAHIEHTGLRALQEVGCVDELLPNMLANPGVDFVTAEDELLARIPGNQGSVSGFPASMYFHQPTFDRTLRRTIANLPTVDVRLGTEVVDLEVHPDHVTVRAIGPTGKPLEVVASYVLACDGAASALREAMRIPLVDLGFHERWIVVDLLLRSKVSSLSDRAVTYADPARPLASVPLPENRYRFEIMLLPGEDPARIQDPAVVLDLISRWVPPGSAEVERAAIYHFHGLVADSWRSGRVLLAGDAAHQMPPFLGQGMNSGLRDAVNLAWKLDLVLQNVASDPLLDTYEAERKPNVRRIIDISVGIGRIVCTLDPDEARRRNQELLAGSSTLSQRFAFKLPALEHGPLVLDGGGVLSAQPIANGRRLDDVVGGRFLVLANQLSALDDCAAWWAKNLGAMVATPDDLPEFADGLLQMLDRHRASVVVVRPDRYVLAAGQRLGAITEEVRPVLAGGLAAHIAAR